MSIIQWMLIKSITHPWILFIIRPTASACWPPSNPFPSLFLSHSLHHSLSSDSRIHLIAPFTVFQYLGKENIISQFGIRYDYRFDYNISSLGNYFKYWKLFEHFFFISNHDKNEITISIIFESFVIDLNLWEKSRCRNLIFCLIFQTQIHIVLVLIFLNIQLLTLFLHSNIDSWVLSRRSSAMYFWKCRDMFAGIHLIFKYRKILTKSAISSKRMA